MTPLSQSSPISAVQLALLSLKAICFMILESEIASLYGKNRSYFSSISKSTEGNFPDSLRAPLQQQSSDSSSS
jgi:hypothetical protein